MNLDKAGSFQNNEKTEQDHAGQEPLLSRRVTSTQRQEEGRHMPNRWFKETNRHTKRKLSQVEDFQDIKTS